VCKADVTQPFSSTSGHTVPSQNQEVELSLQPTPPTHATERTPLLSTNNEVEDHHP
jgi:hypothetical protein